MLITFSIRQLRNIFGFKSSRRFINTARHIEKADLDWEYYKNASNHAEIIENCSRRGFKGDVGALLIQLREKSEQRKTLDDVNFEDLQNQLFWVPNKCHPNLLSNSSENPTLLETVGIKPEFQYVPATFDNLARRLNICRTRFLGHISGRKGYYFRQKLASLERALVKYTLDYLSQRNFTLVSVPDIINDAIIESCGMVTKGERSQIFRIENWDGNLCLSGTSEMALLAHCSDKTFDVKNLPLRFCSVSRCYRAEAKSSHTEKGIYRVHYFTKVEMFGITANETGTESESLAAEFLDIQKFLFSQLGLHFQVLEMPLCDLGLPAYRKVDIEAWMPGRQMYGEISSASNCTDYQSRRLNITYDKDSKKYCHTVNGTACAVPRMIVAIFENFQNFNECIDIPVPLQKYMKDKVIKKNFKEILASVKPAG